jgi:chlorite dismutase
MSELFPGTIEGWYVLHQVVRVDWRALRSTDGKERDALVREAAELFASLAKPEGAGWSAAFRLVGGRADLMLIHCRQTLDELADVQLAVRRSRLGALLYVEYDFTSVTEVGLYHASADAAEEARGDLKKYQALLEEAAAAEGASPHVRTRLYPEPPADMRYVSFYPMSKRRLHPDNWFALPVGERNRMMLEHGLSGRRFSGRIFQVITGALGFESWEWGVTLFAREPLDIKRVVTELRYDEASAKYGEFGEFFVGVRMADDGWAELLAVG